MLNSINISKRFEVPAPSIKFGAGPDTMNDDELKAAADQFRRAIKAAESMAPLPGQTGQNRIAEVMARMLNGDAGMAISLQKHLKAFLDGIAGNRTCEEVLDSRGLSQGYKVVSGAFEKVFEKRTILSGAQTTFEKFVEERLGKKKVIVSFTGWTKPPVAFLKQHPILKKELDSLTPAEQAKFAEQFYVQRIKKFLAETFSAIKRELPEFNPSTDLGFIYGVTEEGVDRAIEEFAQKEGIDMVGLSCYDWAEYIPDATGKPDVFLAKDNKEFGTLMKDNAGKIVVLGGRSYAANVNANAEKVLNESASYPRIPADVLDDYGVDIPAFVEGEDNRTTQVLNAAKVLKTIRGYDPEEWEIMRNVSNPNNISRSALVMSQVLKRSLITLYESRNIQVNGNN